MEKGIEFGALGLYIFSKILMSGGVSIKLYILFGEQREWVVYEGC